MTITAISLAQASGTAIVGWLLVKWMTARGVARGITSSPPHGAIVLLHPFHFLALVLGSIYPFKGQMGWFYAGFSLYKKYGSTSLASTTFWDAQPMYWVADADAVKTITSDRTTFGKDLEAYEPLCVYGPNMIALEGSEWKRHRDIAKSAFNEANNAFVWRETLRIVNEWVSQIDASATATVSHQRPTTQIDLLRDMTRATLLVIGSAGFGRRSTWLEDAKSKPPPGHKVAFSPAVISTIEYLFPRALTPKFIWNAVTERGIYLPFIGPMVLRTRDAFENLRGHMLEVASQARDWFGANQNGDEVDNSAHGAALLKNMVEANMTFSQKDEGEAGYKSLTDEELFSNMFLFLLAGHETSAHTLCFVFVYLALYPEYQQRIFEETFEMYPDGIPHEDSSFAYKDIIRQLEFTSAFFHETLRLHPPGPRIGKIVRDDTSIKSRRFSTSAEGKTVVTQEVDIPLQKGAMCLLDISALHRNPIHWGDDAETFRPERLIDTETYKWPRNAFFAFSGGPRSCIGQRFATTESICIIANIVRRYEVLLPEDVLGLDFEEQKRKLTKWKPGVTSTPTNARVQFRKRDV